MTAQAIQGTSNLTAYMMKKAVVFDKFGNCHVRKLICRYAVVICMLLVNAGGVCSSNYGDAHLWPCHILSSLYLLL